MENLITLFNFLISIAIFTVVILITCGITELVLQIKEKRHRKWCYAIFEKHPELKVLLSEYRRLYYEHCDTVCSIINLQKTIDEQIEQNKYLPHGHRVDAHIEALKERYQKLIDIRAEQVELVNKAKADLDQFWEVNFPNLREDKRIIWWNE